MSARNEQRPNLHELQSWVRWIITDPRGVHEALKAPSPSRGELNDPRYLARDDEAHLRRYNSPQPGCLSTIRSDHGLSQEDRLNIYAEAYFSRISEALSEDFQATARLVGNEAFFLLVADYLKEHPSKFESLADVGYAFADFLERHEAGRALPYLVDLAKLEWKLVESFHAPDLPLLAQEQIHDVPAELWPQVRFTMAPSLKLVKSPWDIDDFRTQIQTEIHESLSCLKIFRQEGAVVVSALSEAEFQALELLTAGLSLEQICLELKNPAGPSGMDQIQTWFSQWIQDGLIARLEY